MPSSHHSYPPMSPNTLNATAAGYGYVGYVERGGSEQHKVGNDEDKDQDKNKKDEEAENVTNQPKATKVPEADSDTQGGGMGFLLPY
ncbi:hypothetical protein VNI00_011470 [Paramarasmius palmivorus]|uniref:Uncharacterized protein n=1 Tax=Paramarasmius palmivorus TaxID=297713 RepID=A0AAW0CA58_9AGAR